MKHASQAVKNYQKFHKRPPAKSAYVDFTPPKALTYLGNLLSISYQSTKGFKRSFKPRGYKHDAGPGVKIYLHPNRRWLLIAGGRFHVTDWMRG
jgi:hypothetical protein